MNNNNSPIMVDGKYNPEKVYNLIHKENMSISAVEFKYGIHRDKILALLDDYHRENKTEDYLFNAQKGDLVSTTYIYEFNRYFIIGKIIKRNLNSVIVERTDGEILPVELLDKIVVSSKLIHIVAKNS